MKHTQITLSHGSGGAESNALIEEFICEILGDVLLCRGEDAGVFQSSVPLAVSTDSYVISPIFFPGGDIGKLSVCGSSNDVAMRGAKPMYLCLGFILEEGFCMEDFRRILHSIKQEAMKLGMKILSGDTKVVPKGSADKIFINTTAIGQMRGVDYSVGNLQVGDEIIVSAPIGTHGAVIFCQRHEIDLQSDLQSDCAQLYPMLEGLHHCALHSMRDATRGGLAAVLNEWSRAVCVEIEIYEQELPILPQVRGVCEILGLEPLSLANEGVCVIAVPQGSGSEVVERLRHHQLGRSACVIGRISCKVEDIHKARVVMSNAWGAKRYVEYPQGELLPRIC